jgi:hypothetical protein
MVAGVTMGYGHLRAAAALAERLDCELTEVDRAPHARLWERALWRTTLGLHIHLSRLSQVHGIGPPLRRLFDRVTAIPPDAPSTRVGTGAAMVMDALLRLGFGARLARHLDATGTPLVSTFYAPAIAADRHGSTPVACLVTDTEAHRVWAPPTPGTSRILYLAPTRAVERRLASYGVSRERIRITGFPLPQSPCHDNRVRANMDRRLARLHAAAHAARFVDEWRDISSSPREDHAGAQPPRLVIAIGGAAAQTSRVRELLATLGPMVRARRVRLTLVAGTDGSLARRFDRWIARAGPQDLPSDQVEILYADDFDDYYRSFNDRLADTDLLWNKPSELVFYAALGLPLILDDPIGYHEWHNRKWALEAGVALERPDPRHADAWLDDHLRRDTFCEVAERAYAGLPRDGADRIADALQTEFTGR